MKTIKKYLVPSGYTGFDWSQEPIAYEEVIDKPLPAPKTAKSETPIKDAVSNLWNRLTSLSGQTMLTNPGGYPMYAGALRFNTTIGDELKVAGAGAATVGVPAALNYAYNYPISVATDLLYGTGGTWLGGKIGNLIGLPIDLLVGNHYTSEGLGYLGNLVGGGLGLNAANNLRKRGIETIMRSGGDLASPVFNSIVGVFKQMPNKRRLSILNYLLTGHRTGPKGYYNSFAPQNWGDKGYGVYNGLTDSGFMEGTDIIDAYLYGKTLDPLIAISLPKNTPHPYMDYIARNYPNKNIPIYLINSEVTLGSKKVDSVSNPSNWRGWPEYVATNPYKAFEQSLDVGGHLEQQGLTETGAKAIRGADIWKFNPKDYLLNWIKPLYKHEEIPYYLRFGLNEVDKAGTPVITITPWIREFNDQEWSNYWDLFVPEAL